MNTTGEALTVINMQKYFFDENRAVDVEHLAANCQAAIDGAHDQGIPVIHVATEYKADRSDWPRALQDNPDSWCSRVVEGHPLSEVVDGIQVDRQRDFCIVKKRFNAFHETALDQLLRSETINCKRLFVVGYAADVCVRQTLHGAYDRSYETAVIEDAVESFRMPKANALENVQFYLNTQVFSLEAFLNR